MWIFNEAQIKLNFRLLHAIGNAISFAAVNTQHDQWVVRSRIRVRSVLPCYKRHTHISVHSRDCYVNFSLMAGNFETLRHRNWCEGPPSSKTCTLVMVVGSKFDYWATVLVDGTLPTHDYCLLSRQNVVCSRLLRTSIFASSFGAQLKRRRRLIGARPLALERFINSFGLLILDLFFIWNETKFNLQDRTKFFFVFASVTSEWKFLLCSSYLFLNEKNCIYALQCRTETEQVYLEVGLPVSNSGWGPGFSY
jgi:hypothetical protein